MTFEIRSATVADVPLILEFIRALARYEKLAHEAVATEQLLRESLFGERRYAEVLIGEEDGAPVAFALFFHNYSTFLARPGIYLEDLFVKPEARGRGYGARLFDRAMLHARNRGCDRLFIHALSENSAMLKIAANAGATVQRDGPESEAWLKLPPDDLASRVDELVSQQAAELDFRFKVHAHRMNRLMGMVRDVGDHISEKGRIASE